MHCSYERKDQIYQDPDRIKSRCDQFDGLDGVRALDHGNADVNLVDKISGTPPLCLSISIGNFECTEILIENSACVEKKQKNGWTPLYIASLRGCEKSVELLIEKKADVNQPVHGEASPLWASVMNGNIKCMMPLINANADVNSMQDGDTLAIQAAKCRASDTLRLLLLAGADIQKSDQKGRKAIDWAWIMQDILCVKLCIHAHIDRGDIKEINKLQQSGYTLAYMAAFFNLQDCIIALVKAGADASIS